MINAQIITWLHCIIWFYITKYNINFSVYNLRFNIKFNFVWNKKKKLKCLIIKGLRWSQKVDIPTKCWERSFSFNEKTLLEKVSNEKMKNKKMLYCWSRVRPDWPNVTFMILTRLYGFYTVLYAWLYLFRCVDVFCTMLCALFNSIMYSPIIWCIAHC